MAQSPCINLCRMSPDTGLCLGCYRTLEEIAGWSGLNEAAQQAVLAAVEVRRSLDNTDPHHE